MEKIAVTGATGFIGRHLVQGLLRAGHIVYPIGRTIRPVECDRVYHLACPGNTKAINENPTLIMDTIFDVTRQAMNICPSALFVNGSSMGVAYLDETAQGAYNIAKRSMEIYLKHSGIEYVNYNLPSVYGEDMDSSNFIKRCVEGTAYEPTEPNKEYWICHIDDVVDALIELNPIPYEATTIGQIYELFNSGRRGLHRPTPNPSSV